MLLNVLRLMSKKKGDISKSGSKAKIIEFILDNKKNPVEESKIRGFFEKDQGGVNNHLHDFSTSLTRNRDSKIKLISLAV
jgi:hypothetical protein